MSPEQVAASYDRAEGGMQTAARPVVRKWDAPETINRALAGSGGTEKVFTRATKFSAVCSSTTFQSSESFASMFHIAANEVLILL
jgi:hypothetical protein